MAVRLLDESARLEALFRYRVLDTEPEAEFDAIAHLTAQICQVPIALINFVSGDRYWSKSRIGLELPEISLELSFCAHVVQQTNLLIVSDTLADERFCLHPLVVVEPYIRFYAGAPLITPEGFAIGTLCVMDRVARSLSLEQQKALQTLSHQVVALLELRRKSAELEAIASRTQTQSASETTSKRKLTRLLESITDAFFTLDHNWRFTYLNPQAERALFKSRSELLGRSIWNEFPEAVGSVFEQEYRRSIAQQTAVHFEEFYLPLGTWFEVRAFPHQEGLSVYFRDVTTRKQSEMDLLQRSHLSEFIAAMGVLLAQGGALSEILERCVETTVQYLDATFVRIWTYNAEAKLLELQAIAGQHSHVEDFYSRIPLSISIIGFIAQLRQPYLTNDVQNDICIGAKDWVQREKLASFAGYPLIVEDRLVGVMALFCRQPLSEATLNTLGWIANSVAVAIDRIWAREALMSRREALLFRLASQIRESLNLDVILGTTVSEVRSLLQVDRCHFLWCWMNDDQPSLVVTHESCDAGLPSLLGDCLPEETVPLAAKILNLQMIRIDGVTKEPERDAEVQELLNRSGIVAQLLVPLETQSNQLGAIVCSHSRAHAWSDSEVELLHAVVDQVAIAIEQAELYAKTRAAAFAAETQAQQLTEALQNLQQTQSQLIQTEKMSSLGQMVAGIAHEINNPVNFITGNLVHANNYTKDLLHLIQLYQQYYPDPALEIQTFIKAIDIEFVANDLPKLLASMRLGADRIRQIVLSLRNFSRLDEAAMKPVNIHEGIDSTLLILHNRLKSCGNGAGIQVIKQYGVLPPVECYAGQLNQVFMNILSNAIDALEGQSDPKVTAPKVITIQTEFAPDLAIASPTASAKATSTNGTSAQKTPTQNISAETSLAETTAITIQAQSNSFISRATQTALSLDPELDQLLPGTVTIRIQDNGLGMTPAIRERLFDPFFTTKPVGKGTGLGMSISYQIVVQKHGGSLECRSALGHGTEFILQIPSVPRDKIS
jgi:two-component system NtrC family sensor kinase